MNRVKEFRERAEIRQYALARAVSKSPAWLWKLENGLLLGGLRPEVRRRLAETLGVPEGDVFPQGTPRR